MSPWLTNQRFRNLASYTNIYCSTRVNIMSWNRGSVASVGAQKIRDLKPLSLAHNDRRWLDVPQHSLGEFHLINLVHYYYVALLTSSRTWSDHGRQSNGKCHKQIHQQRHTGKCITVVSLYEAPSPPVGRVAKMMLMLLSVERRMCEGNSPK